MKGQDESVGKIKKDEKEEDSQPADFFSDSGTTNLKYNFEQDVAPFVGLLALESSLGNKPLPRGQGDELPEMWSEALREWYVGNRGSSLPMLEKLLSKLSEFGMSQAPVSGLVNHQYGMQLRVLGHSEEALTFLDRAVQIYLDWIDKHNAQSGTNIVISSFSNFLFAIADAALGQLAYECNSRGNHLDALDYSEKGLEISQRTESPSGELVHTVNVALAHFHLGETKSARKFYDQALQLARGNPGNSQHDKEQYAFACWQLGKLAEKFEERAKARTLFSTASSICASWVEPDMVPYFEQFRSEIGR